MFKSSTARVRLFTQFKLERRSSLLFCKSYQELINNSPSMSTVRIIFFRFIPFRSKPRNSECLGMSTLFRGITESVPSQFQGIFWNKIPFQTLCIARIRSCAVCHELISLLYTDRIHESTLSLGILRREFKRN
jgi:hypothetical protein